MQMTHELVDYVMETELRGAGSNPHRFDKTHLDILLNRERKLHQFARLFATQTEPKVNRESNRFTFCSVQYVSGDIRRNYHHVNRVRDNLEPNTLYLVSLVGGREIKCFSDPHKVHSELTLDQEITQLDLIILK